MKSFMKAFTEQLSHCYQLIMLMKDQSYWALVFVLTYVHKPTARRLAIRWADKLREKIVKKHQSNPEAINHMGKQPEDNLSYMLAIISRFRSQCQEHFMQVRTAARIHMKGKGLIIGRELKWVDNNDQSVSNA